MQGSRTFLLAAPLQHVFSQVLRFRARYLLCLPRICCNSCHRGTLGMASFLRLRVRYGAMMTRPAVDWISIHTLVKSRGTTFLISFVRARRMLSFPALAATIRGVPRW